MAAEAAEQKRMVMKYRTEKVEEMVDDNPRFGSAMRMATPAPPAPSPANGAGLGPGRQMG